jgi:CheY-like chemotaxis protein
MGLEATTEAQREDPGATVVAEIPKRVLVVDDDLDIRDVLVELLEGEGYRVSAAGDGQQALREASRNPPDVILLDLMMPVMSGWQFRAAQLRDPVLARIPVVVLSAFANDLDVAAFVPKPFFIEEVLDTIRRVAA